MSDTTIATNAECENDRTLTFDPDTGRLEAETYADGEGSICVGFNLTDEQRRNLAALLLSRMGGS